MLPKLLTSIFGSRNDRLLKQYRSVVARINGLEAQLEQLSDEQLKGKTQEFREQSRRFSAYWSGSGESAELVPMHGKNHYTILCDLLEERSEIAGEIMRMAEAFRRETGRGRH